jgi:glycerate 2-kinase
MFNGKKLAEDIFIAATEAVKPAALVSGSISINESSIVAGGITLPLNSIENVYVIGAGKASAAMASEIEKIFGERITGGHIIVKYGHNVPLKKIIVTEAGHPIPDSNGFMATRRIVELVEKAGENDLVICLLSGGGSALLADVPDNISQADMIIMNDLLIKSGADISAVNTARKHLSSIKGGRLALKVFPAALINSLIR